MILHTDTPTRLQVDRLLRELGELAEDEELWAVPGAESRRVRHAGFALVLSAAESARELG